LCPFHVSIRKKERNIKTKKERSDLLLLLLLPLSREEGALQQVGIILKEEKEKEKDFQYP